MTSIIIEDLTPAEKLELINKLWDSLESDDVPLTDAQKQELDRRLGLDEPGTPWEEVAARLRPPSR